MTNPSTPWWKRIQWTDAAVVVIAVVVLLLLTMELWLPHHGTP